MTALKSALAARCGLEILGVRVDALSIADLVAVVVDAVASRRRTVIGNHNLHSLSLYQRDAGMRAFYRRADFVYIDGMPFIWLGGWRGLPLRREHRITFIDFMPPLVDAAARRGWRIFYLGSAPGVAERGAQIIRARFPGLQMATRHGFFDMRPDGGENRAVVAAINAYRPDLLFVGMGMPRQEQWIVENFARLETGVAFALGAGIDYFAGIVPTPPRWMGRAGLEWLSRLLAEPGRLAGRYLVEPWSLRAAVLADLRAGLARRWIAGAPPR